MSVNSKMTAIANAIRTKRGISSTLSLDQMATEIGNIQTGITPTGTKNITANGNYDVTQFANASVNVPPPTPVINIRINKEYTVTWTDDYRWNTSNVPDPVSASGYSASNVLDVSDADYIYIVWSTMGNLPSSYKYYSRLIGFCDVNGALKQTTNNYFEQVSVKMFMCKNTATQPKIRVNKLKAEQCHIYSVSFN